jgi:transposase-like protein
LIPGALQRPRNQDSNVPPCGHLRIKTWTDTIESGWKHDPAPQKTKTNLNEDESSKPLDCLLLEEIKRRTHVIRIFPNEESALRLIRALAVEIHEDWIEAHRYLSMEMLREQRKQLQLLEAA